MHVVIELSVVVIELLLCSLSADLITHTDL